MKFEPKTDIKEVVRNASLYNPIPDEEIDSFKTHIDDFLDLIKVGQGEQTQAGFLKTMLEKAFYEEKSLIVLEENKKDMSIKSEHSSDSDTYVFIETKKIDSNEMVCKDNLEAKAFYETIYYYMNERNDGNDVLKYIVITNMVEWCIIDALEYARLFWRNRAFRQLYDDFKHNRLSYNTTIEFYNKGIAPFVNESNATIHYTYFNLQDEFKSLNHATKKKYDALYKILSPNFMFKQYELNPVHELDNGFYAELLYIMGLEEVEIDNIRYIRRSTERNEGSLIENAIEQIKMRDFSHLNVEGDTIEERIFNAALQLSIIWVNRLLFLKLLEGQLCLYHKGHENDYKFLNATNIKNYGDLGSLFFNVLAVSEDNRSESIKAKFPYVPYLNSSLFDYDQLEIDAAQIYSLSNDAKLPLFKHSVLKNYAKFKNGKISALEYILQFLGSFDFSADKSAREDTTKRIISASVLGLIFEKINGYKDGSIFTPPKITMLMSKKTLRRAVVDKFKEKNETFRDCENLTDVFNHIKDKKEANEIINSLKICDPAVGSGHFLVSALNELIAIKSYLGIILDDEGRMLRDYNIEVQNDELVIIDDEGMQFSYQPSKIYKSSQRVQEIIFKEKRDIIEVNPKVWTD